MEKEYDIALSFAGEDREYVDIVAESLKVSGIDVFYDNFFEVDLWGKDLYQYFSELYKNKAIYTVIFISKHYKEKLWARHELKSAQARAFEENYEYILPVRFDDSEIPGILRTTGYLDISNMIPKLLAKKIEEKLLDNDYFDKTKLTNAVFDSLVINDGWNDTTKYFHYEFSNAFPDIYQSHVFKDKREIQHRLAVLLRNPTAKESSNSAHDPIWWFRGPSALDISRYKVIDKDRCLINQDELDIEEIYVNNSGSYWQDYVYIITRAQKQIGVNDYSEEEIEEERKRNGYIYETYGLYKNEYIKPNEIGNGNYVKNGMVHPIKPNQAEIRYRYLTKYSFFIAAKANPLNCHNPKVQIYIEKFCNDNINGNASIEEFNEFYNKLGRIDQKY